MTLVDEAHEAAKALRIRLHRLEDAGLRIVPECVWWNRDQWAQAEQALALLRDPDAPLASRYPDGSSAHPPFTPRQVMLLAESFGSVPITHKEEVYRIVHAELSEEMGHFPPRICTGSTADGSPCRAHALPWEIDRERWESSADPPPPLMPVEDMPQGEQRCHHHASDDLRHFAKERKQEFERRLHVGLEEWSQKQDKMRAEDFRKAVDRLRDRRKQQA